MARLRGPIGRCIYCGRDNYADGERRALGDEHVIPYGINGDMILQGASCQACERITGHVEQICLGHHLAGARRFMGLESRTPLNRRGKTLPLYALRQDGSEYRVDVDVEDYPIALFFLPISGPAPLLRHISGEPQSSGAAEVYCRFFRYEPDLLREKYGIERMAAYRLNLPFFCRMLAKIAHAHAVWEHGIDGFTPLLNSVITDPDKDARDALAFVGGADALEPVERALHSVALGIAALEGKPRFLVTRIRLFAQFGAPTYYVVVGVPKGQTAPPLPEHLGELSALHNTYRTTFSGPATPPTLGHRWDPRSPFSSEEPYLALRQLRSHCVPFATVSLGTS